MKSSPLDKLIRFCLENKLVVILALRFLGPAIGDIYSNIVELI